MNNVMSKVFLWLFLGLALTFGVGYYVSTNSTMLYNIFSDGKHILFAVIEIVIAIFLSVRINKMSSMTAGICYLLYAGFSGLTFSAIFVVYELTSIMFVFGIAAVLFLIFGLAGSFTKLDLSKFSTFLFMGLIGLLLAYVVSMFVDSSTFDFALAAFGIVLFLGFTAFDMQAIKRNWYGIQSEDNHAIFGAFQLYIDFINIVIDLLRIFGKGKD